MREQVRHFLDRIKHAYEPERIELSKRRLLAVWNGKTPEDRIPFVFFGLPCKHDPECNDHDESLFGQLQQILERVYLSDDYVPGLFPGLRQATIPGAFGSYERMTGEHRWTTPVIRKPRDVYDLPEPDFGPSTVGGFMLERMKHYFEATRGQLDIHITDLQGPFSVACQLWGDQNMFLALYECPDEVRYLLNITTDAVIKYSKLMVEAVQGRLVPIHCQPDLWMPLETGLAVSEDHMAVVSPSVFREFIAPGLNRISQEFGGIVVHSCGDIEHNIDEILRLDGIKAINFSTSETDIEDVARKVQGSVAMLAHTAPVASRHLKLLSSREHAELCFTVIKKYAIQGVVFVPGARDLHKTYECAKWIAKHASMQ